MAGCCGGSFFPFCSSSPESSSGGGTIVADQHISPPVSLWETPEQLRVVPGLGWRGRDDVGVQGDAVCPHLEAEHGVRQASPVPTPMTTAVAAALAFTLGSAVPPACALLVPAHRRIAVTFVAVLLSLVATSVIVAGTDRTQVLPMLRRSVLTGVVAMALSLGVGYLFRG